MGSPRRQAGASRVAPRLLAPGAWLLRQVPMWGKVALVTAVLAGPLTIALTAAITTARSAEELTRAELSGLPAVTALNQLALTLGACADARIEGRDGKNIRPALRAVARGMAGASVSRRTGAAWRHLENTLDAKLRTDGIGCRLSEASAADLQALVDLALRVADDTRLSLDSYRRTYYLQMALTVHLPRLVAGLVDVQRQLAIGLRDIDDQALVVLEEAVYGAKNAAVRLQMALQRAAGSRPSGRDAQMLALAVQLRSWAVTEAGAVGGISHGHGARIAGAKDLVDPDAQLVAAEKLVDDVSVRLEGLLRGRVADQRASWRNPALAALASLALVLYLMIALGWSISRDLLDIRRALAAAASGERHAPTQLFGRDELGSVAAAVSRTRQQISSLLSQLSRSAERHESYVSQSSDVTVVADGAGRLSYVSPSLVHVLGIEPQQWLDQSLAELVDARDRPAMQRALAGLLRGNASGEVRARFPHADGRTRYIGARYKDARADRAVAGVVWNLRDVTDEQELADQLRHQAFHDDLTGLANRALFLDRLQQALDRTGRTQREMAVCVLDLDGFKAVNDHHGHQTGDELLMAAGERFLAAVRSGDTVGRLGGDEFGVIIEDAGPGAATVVAHRLAESMRSPVHVSSGEIATSSSVGVALVRGSGLTADQVLHQADMAMYNAKTNGRGLVRVFDPGMLRTDPRVVCGEIMDLLQDPDGIAMVFQPICDLRDATVVGYEALARFPGRESRDVGEWFALARDCGCGAQLEAAALEAALSAPGRPAGTYLTVNVSPATLTTPDVQAVLDRDLTGIVIEITEDSRLDATLLRAAVEPLRRRGARIAVDDTGAGYANLRQLVQLRPDIVKLDREIVTAVNEHLEKRALVEALVSFCRRTGAVLCAEGVENVEELVTIADLGAHLAQGWFLARPAASFGSVSTGALLALGGSVPRGRTTDLSSVHARLAAALVPGEVAEALGVLTRLMLVDDVALSQVRHREMAVVSHHAWTTGGSVYRLDDYPATQRALDTGEPVAVRVDDSTSDQDEVRLLREIGYGSLLIVPVVHDGEQLGVIELYARTCRAWSEQEVLLAQEAARSTAVALVRLGSPQHHPADLPA